MAIEIVDLPIKNGGSFHSYVKLPEGNRVESQIIINQQGGWTLLQWEACWSDPSTVGIVKHWQLFCFTIAPLSHNHLAQWMSPNLGVIFIVL